MTLIPFPQMLLIAATGRNSGKTTLVCNIIRKFSTHYPIVAIKISSHFHKNYQGGKEIITSENLVIAEEINPEIPKDSSRMLKAGAQKSYFVMATDLYLLQAFHHIRTLVPPDALFVCESGGLRNWLNPGIFLMMNRIETIVFKAGTEKLKPLADKWITFNGQEIDFDIDSIEINNNRWQLKS